MAPYFSQIAGRHHCSCRKTLNWCSKYKTSVWWLLLYTLTIKCTRFLNLLLMHESHVLFSLPIKAQNNPSFIRSRKKILFRKIMDHSVLALLKCLFEIKRGLVSQENLNQGILNILLMSMFLTFNTSSSPYWNIIRE